MSSPTTRHCIVKRRKVKFASEAALDLACEGELGEFTCEGALDLTCEETVNVFACE